MNFKRFSLTDLAQQIIGGLLLAGPFIITEEVWTLAENMTLLQSFGTVVVILMIGYGALYEADEEREPDEETDVGGVPVRLISLIAVSYLSVGLITFMLNVPVVFDATNSTVLKAISIASIFSLIGAATVDSLL